MDTDKSVVEQIRSDPKLNDMRANITRLAAMMYDKQLTDAAGGNLSARVGEYICITPRFSGSRNQWHLRPEQVLVADMNLNILDGEGEISREAKAHFTLHREFREHGTGVIHAHARNLLVFAAANKPMPPVLEATQKFGTVPVVDFAPAHSQDLAEHIAAAIRGNESRIRKQAACVIAPWHGLFVMGKDIEAAYDAVERMDTNAYILLMAGALGASPMLDRERVALEAALKKYEQH